MTTIKLGLWNLEVDFDRECVICSNCGQPLMNLQIRAIETGTFYCSDDCAKVDVNKVTISELDGFKRNRRKRGKTVRWDVNYDYINRKEKAK